MRTTFPLLALLILPGILAAEDKKLNFQDNILPLLREKCASCHNPDNKKGGFNVTNFTEMMEGGARGASVEPGDPERSTLYLLMAHVEEPHMPPKSPKLPDKDLQLVANWIKAGALENSGSVAATKPKTDLSLKTAARGKPEGPPPMPTAALALEPVVRTPRGNAITALAASPWAPLLAVSSTRSVLLYHADTRELLGVLPFPEGQVHVLKFSRNGSLLLAAGGRGGQSGRAVVFEVATGNRVIEVGEETDAILAADISPDQSLLALGNSSKMVRLYSTADGTVVHQLKKHTDWVTALEFSPDGVLLATGDRNGGLAVWEAGSGQEFVQLRGPQLAITDLSWRPDGNVVAVSSEDAQIRLFEVENGTQVRAWGAHGGGALSVRYHHDGRLVSTGRDRVTKIWDGNGALQKQTPGLPDVALKVAWAHDGQTVLTGDWLGQVHLHAAGDGKAVALVVSNPASLEERLAEVRQRWEAAKAQQAQTAAQAATFQAAVDQATTALTALQQQITEAEAAVKQTQAAATAAAQDPTLAAAQAAQQAVPSKEQAAAKLAEAAARAKEAAEQLGNPAELAAFALQSQALATKHAAELAAAKDYAQQMLVAAKPAQERLTAAQAEAGKAQAAHKAASEQLPGKQAALKTAQEQLAPVQQAAQAAGAEVQTLQAQLERMQRAKATTQATSARTASQPNN